MSCEVIAIPYAIAWVIGAVAASAADSVAEAVSDAAAKNSAKKTENCEDVTMITAEHFLEKDFKTPFVDKSILLKTLEEHGASSIEENNNTISCCIDKYTLTFDRNSENEPYNLRMGCPQNNLAEEKVNDISSEYAMNVQEDAYMSIIEKLKDNNMQIEEEEVTDDNTIVLTVNIE